MESVMEAGEDVCNKRVKREKVRGGCTWWNEEVRKAVRNKEGGMYRKSFIVWCLPDLGSALYDSMLVTRGFPQEILLKIF